MTISTLYDLLVFLSVPLIGWEVFHRLNPYPVFFLSFPLGYKGFHQRHDPLRLISFLTGLGYFQWSPGFPSQSFSLGWEVFQQTTLTPILIPTRLMELTSKKKGNCNVMIKKLADHRLYMTHQLYPFVLKS